MTSLETRIQLAASLLTVLQVVIACHRFGWNGLNWIGPAMITSMFIVMVLYICHRVLVRVMQGYVVDIDNDDFE